jgi:hypothetical protein
MATSSRTAVVYSTADFSRPHRQGLAGGGPGYTRVAHFGRHRRGAGSRFFGDGHRAAFLPRGGGDDELYHTADHDPGGRRRLYARGQECSAR